MNSPQPYVPVGSTNEWRRASSDKPPFSAGSRFQLQSPDIPTEASRLVQEQNLHYAFGDFDDHLEDVTIGESCYCCLMIEAKTLMILDWLRNRACLP